MEHNNWKNKFDNEQNAFTPSDNVWNSIDQTITKKRRKKRAVIFLLSIASILIPITILSLIQFDVINLNKNSNEKINRLIFKDSLEKRNQQDQEIITKTKKVQEEANSTKQEFWKQNEALNSRNKANRLSSNNTSEKNRIHQQTKVSNKSNTNSNFNSHKLNQVKLDSIKLSSFGIIKNELILNPELMEKEDEHQTNKDSKLNWAVKPFFGSNLMQPLHKEHPLASANPNLSQNFQLNYSYGAQFFIQLDKKFWLYTGIAFQNYSYQAKHINISPERTPSLMHYINTRSNNFVSQQTIENFSNSSEEITLNYKLDYYEIPIMASYKVIDKKLNIFAEGGGSVLHLRNNNVSMSNYNDEDLNLGEFNIFNNSHFTLQAGLLAELPLSKRFSFEAEGLYKYHFNIVDNVNTYSINFNLGVKYKFKY